VKVDGRVQNSWDTVVDRDGDVTAGIGLVDGAADHVDDVLVWLECSIGTVELERLV